MPHKKGGTAGCVEPSPKLENGRGEQPRRNKGSLTMPRRATKLTGVNFTPHNFSPIFSEAEAAKEFSAVIVPFSTGELALATKRSKDTAKCWKRGRAFPNGVSLMALVHEFPEIRAWVKSKTGEFEDSKSLASRYQTLEEVMFSDSALAKKLRSRMLQLLAERNAR